MWTTSNFPLLPTIFFLLHHWHTTTVPQPLQPQTVNLPLMLSRQLRRIASVLLTTNLPSCWPRLRPTPFQVRMREYSSPQNSA
ncbi:hypothetical protein BC830DRAFT_1114410 [Chytriomyces sp. MP71]|nr:hypothetical protein BC830DRAFT_1114410 [Chytriomyces sp. MP71]